MLRKGDNRFRVWDAAVVGAGVAGLTAARELAARGRSVLLVEARERVGGRIHTDRDGVVRELGAEFIHGGNDAYWAALRRLGVRAREVPQLHWVRDPKTGGLRREDGVWDRVAAVMKAIGAGPRSRGSVAAVWRKSRARISPSDALMARNFIEGFEAAPLDRMSAAAMVSLGEEERQWRLPRGYDALALGLGREFRAAGGVLRLGSPVERVRLQPGGVTLEGTGWTETARVVVLAVPPGPELAIRFEPGPALRRRRALLRRAGLGQVRRVTLVFASTFWRSRLLPQELRGARGENFGFIHAQGEAFPTWWARPPDPVLVGWVGGPGAAKLANLTPARIAAAAVASLAHVLGARPREIRAHLKEVATHDWAGDPWTQGAYSYAQADREALPDLLAKPAGGVLFFAGEATADVSELGTVHGAHASGLRAAAQAESALRKRKRQRRQGAQRRT